MSMSKTISVGLVGARGHAGSELIRLFTAHPRFALGFVSSRERAGEALAAHEPSYTGDLHYVNFDATQAAQQGMDALVLALPNGLASPLDRQSVVSGKSGAVLVDIGVQSFYKKTKQ